MPAYQKDLYQVLGLNHGVSIAHIRDAFEAKLEKLRRIHTAESSARVAELERAAAILLNSDTKEAYDDGWKAGRTGRSVERQVHHDFITIDDDDDDDDDIVDIVSSSSSLDIVKSSTKHHSHIPARPSKRPKSYHRLHTHLTPKTHLGALQEIKEATIDEWKDTQCVMTVARHAWKYDSDPMVRLCAGELYEDLAAEEARAKIRKQKATNELVEERERTRVAKKQYQRQVAEAKSAALVVKRMKQRRIDMILQRGGGRLRL